jgi:HEAT repeat protein
MSAVELVTLLLIVIGSAIAVVLGTVVASGIIQARRTHPEALLRDARQAIIAALSGDPSGSEHAFAPLNRFSKQCIVSVLLELAPSVSGESRSVLISLGERLGVLPRARAGLQSHRWALRLYSARVLTAFGVESDVVCSLLSDRSPEVRAQAAAWSVVKPSPSAVSSLIHLLDDDNGLCRFAAQDALIRIGLPGVQALIDALTAANEEVAARILTIAGAMGDERFYASAVAFTVDPAPRTRALAAAVLARIGDPTAGPLLIALLDDEADEVVAAAAAALATLSYWPGAARVEPLLTHTSWDLREQGALTLLALGAPGTILLSATASGNGPAAEMASQALQLRSLSIQEEAA